MNRLILARKARLHAESGLTLVEIIIVIAILGTLMAILAGSLFGAQDEANVDMTRLQISQVVGKGSGGCGHGVTPLRGAPAARAGCSS